HRLAGVDDHAVDVGGSFLDDDEEAVDEDIAIDRAAAHPDGRDRRLDGVSARILSAVDEAEGALGRRQHDIAQLAVRRVYGFVELDLRLRADAEARLVEKDELRETVRAGLDDLLLK